MSERVEGMAEEQKQAPAPGGAPRREGGHGGGHGGPGGGHGGPRREGGPGGGGPGGPGGRPRGKRQYFRKKKVCKFCVEKMDFIDYKRADILSQFVQERGKILPRRMTGVCARHQRWLAWPSSGRATSLCCRLQAARRARRRLAWSCRERRRLMPRPLMQHRHRPL